MTGENLWKTRHPKIFIGKIATFSQKEVDQIIERLRSAVTQHSEQQVRRVFSEYLPDANVQQIDDGQPVKALTAEDAFFTQPTKLGLAEK